MIKINMINLIKRNLLLVALLASVSVISCKDAWKDHNELNIQALDKTLIEQINTTSDLSLFKTYLEKTGYDKVLASSKTFTVWAPLNSALQNLDPAIVNDTAKLKAFVGNHISFQSYFTSAPKPTLTIKMLNGKNIVFTATKFENATIVNADLYLKNGVLHTINEASEPKPNAWEYLQTSVAGAKQAAYIASLYHTEIDVTNGVPLYVDPITQEIVYQEGTTFPVQRNTFFQKAADISSEDSLITSLILTDAAFDAEVAKLATFNKNIDPVKAEQRTKFTAVKDLVFRGVYDLNNLPDSLISTTGVKVHLNKNDVVATRQLSNGVAYVVSSIGYKLYENKIPTVIIEGELTDSIRTPSLPIYKYQKLPTPTGQFYTQIQGLSISSSPSPLYFFRYKTTVYSTKYQVFWRSINDVPANVPISMVVKFNPERKKENDANTVSLLYKTVPIYVPTDPTTYQETYLGDYTPAYAGDLYAFLVSALGVTSTTPTALSLDYIKLVPIN